MQALESRGAVCGLYRCQRTIVDGRKSLPRSGGELELFAENEYRYIFFRHRRGGNSRLVRRGIWLSKVLTVLFGGVNTITVSLVGIFWRRTSVFHWCI